ncbi:MAG: hypothetical protein QNI99_14105 [Woeseiaceae bacterium]|nr:hypothetical protein [Woeseiaceae bacterium]
MRHKLALAALAATMIITAVGVSSNEAKAGVAGQWTKCIMYLTDGRQVNVANGQYSRDVCFNKAKAGAEANGWSYRNIVYRSNPVIINAPYVLLRN